MELHAPLYQNHAKLDYTMYVQFLQRACHEHFAAADSQVQLPVQRFELQSNFESMLVLSTHDVKDISLYSQDCIADL